MLYADRNIICKSTIAIWRQYKASGLYVTCILRQNLYLRYKWKAVVKMMTKNYISGSHGDKYEGVFWDV